MVHGNVGQSDLTREDMTRYIRYLVDVIGEEQKELYSHLHETAITNHYICLHGECQPLADWISVLLEAYNQPFERCDLHLDLLILGRSVANIAPTWGVKSEIKLEDVPRQITDWYKSKNSVNPYERNPRSGRKYLHTVIEWDGLYWDANGGGTRQQKEEYYEGMDFWEDRKPDRKRLLNNFFEWDELKNYLGAPLVEESIDYAWYWRCTDESYFGGGVESLPDELWIDGLGWLDGDIDNLGVFRDFINHLRMDDFAAERIYFDDEYGGFIKGNPRANELPGEVAFPGEEERLAKIMTPEEYAELEQEVNLIVSKNLPYNVESLSEDERIALHEDIILKIVNHEYIHQSIDDEVLEWAIENNKTKGEYYAAHEIMAYVDMALRESIGMRGFKLHLTNLVAQHPILTDNPELCERVMDALTRTRKGQRFQVPAEIETLMRAFQSEDYEILVVGGAVRDMLMGLKPKDYDLATNATPEDVESVVSTLEGYRTVTTPEAQMARGVLTTLVLPPSGEVIEVTTFRAELGYKAGTRRPVAVAADTFYEDSLRRDFTMNALGWRLNGTILDYHEGVDDIEFGQLVAVGDASERLEEDPLRILRAVRFASRYGLEIDEELGGAIETNLPQLLTLSPERIRRELDTILKSEEGVYDLFETGILETIIPEYAGVYWGERHYDELPVITSVRSYGQIDRDLTPYEQGLGWKSQPWQPAVAYALLLQGRLTREEFNEQYRRGPISFSKAEADMIAELIELYPVALESEEPADIMAIVTSPYYAELMLMLEYTNRLDLVDYFTPYRQRYKGKPPKGYAMTVADEYGIVPGPALGDKISEITEAIILGDIEDWDEGLNYYAAEGVYNIGGYRIDLSKTYSPEEVFEIAANNHLAGPSAERDPYEPNFENPEYDVLLNEIMESSEWEIIRFGEKELREKPVNYTWMNVSSQIDSDGTPIVISNSANIIDGNHRFTAALKGTHSLLAFVPKGEVWWLDWLDEFPEEKQDYFDELDADLSEVYAAEEFKLNTMRHLQRDIPGDCDLIWSSIDGRSRVLASGMQEWIWDESDFEDESAYNQFVKLVEAYGAYHLIHEEWDGKYKEWHSIDSVGGIVPDFDNGHSLTAQAHEFFQIKPPIRLGSLNRPRDYAAEGEERIAYAGVILDEDTSEQLLAHFESEIPESWTRYAHHMTVSLGKSIPNQADLGTEVTLTVTAVGKSDDAIAVAVSGYPSRNAIPHITLAVPPGGKPFNSNKITDWHSVEPFEIQGQLQDVKTYVAEEAETFRSESSRDWSLQYTWQPVPVEDLVNFRRTGLVVDDFDDILNLKTLYRGTRKPSSIRESMFGVLGSGEINESEQIPETVYFYTWERPYPTEQWERHNANFECYCDECDKYAFNYSFASSKVAGLIRSNQFKPEWEETPEGSEVVRVLLIPHMRGVTTPTVYRGTTRRNLDLPRYGFEPVIWSDRNSKNSNGEFYSSPYNTNLRVLEQRLGRGVGRTLNYPHFSSETETKYAESFWETQVRAFSWWLAIRKESY